ncbi:collagen alpha-1(I) chain-like [Muntiacus reevesi]|uniref:collagen alpha-1(I) chain-like n=1 Tax=Muntiacus reevesi TaxID=9886 RepID=UPI003307B7A7
MSGPNQAAPAGREGPRWGRLRGRVSPRGHGEATWARPPRSGPPPPVTGPLPRCPRAGQAERPGREAERQQVPPPGGWGRHEGRGAAGAAVQAEAKAAASVGSPPTSRRRGGCLYTGLDGSNPAGSNSQVESCDADPTFEPGLQKGAGNTHGARVMGVPTSPRDRALVCDGGRAVTRPVLSQSGRAADGDCPNHSLAGQTSSTRSAGKELATAASRRSDHFWPSAAAACWGPREPAPVDGLAPHGAAVPTSAAWPTLACRPRADQGLVSPSWLLRPHRPVSPPASPQRHHRLGLPDPRQLRATPGSSPPGSPRESRLKERSAEHSGQWTCASHPTGLPIRGSPRSVRDTPCSSLMSDKPSLAPRPGGAPGAGGVNPPVRTPQCGPGGAPGLNPQRTAGGQPPPQTRTHCFRGWAPRPHKAASSAQEGPPPGSCLTPAQPGAGSAGLGIPDDGSARSPVRAWHGLREHRPQTTDSPEARTTADPGGRGRFSEDAHGCCRTPHSLRLARAGGLCKQRRPPAPPPGGGCGVPPRAEASVGLVLSREEKGKQEHQRLGKAPTPGTRTALPDRAVQPGPRAEPSQAGRSVTQVTRRCPSGAGSNPAKRLGTLVSSSKFRGRAGSRACSVRGKSWPHDDPEVLARPRQQAATHHSCAVRQPPRPGGSRDASRDRKAEAAARKKLGPHSPLAAPHPPLQGSALNQHRSQRRGPEPRGDFKQQDRPGSHHPAASRLTVHPPPADPGQASPAALLGEITGADGGDPRRMLGGRPQALHPH